MPDSQLKIIIHYDGLDADQHRIDLEDFGNSIIGAGKLIRAAYSVALIRPPPGGSVQIKILAGPPQNGSFEIIAWLAPLAVMLPYFQPAITKAIEALVNYAISKCTKRSDDADKAFAVATKALEELGLTTRAAIEAAVKMSEGQRSAARQFMTPIGDSVRTARIGRKENGAVEYNDTDRDAINKPDEITIGDEDSFDILISELDLKNRSCKFQLKDQDQRRYSGTVTDPAIGVPNNPYSLALSEKRWLKVRAKPEIVEDEITHLFISNAPDA